MQVYPNVRRLSLTFIVRGYAISVYFKELHQTAAGMILSASGFLDRYQTSPETAVELLFGSTVKTSQLADELIDSRLHERMSKHRFGFVDASFMQGLASPQNAMLYFACRALRPNTIVETGVGDGVSTAHFLQALEKNGSGRLYSLDIDDQVGSAIPDDLKKRWTFVRGPTRSTLNPLLDELDKIEIFLHDSEHTYRNMLFEYRSAWPHLSKGGLLMSDDVGSNLAFARFCSERSPMMISNLGIVRAS